VELGLLNFRHAACHVVSTLLIRVRGKLFDMRTSN
jgi:hypothetical protein